jgi:L-lactate dehydrogenase complex protein LldG
MATTNPVLENIRRALGRASGDTLSPPPPLPAARINGDLEDEVDLLISEINRLAGVALRIGEAEIKDGLERLVQEQEVKKATAWATPGLRDLQIETHLRSLGVIWVPPDADKRSLATCDLGITEVDYALPQTGTLALLSSPEKPRSLSLLPRIHLAILRPSVLRADLQDVFVEAKNQPYMVFISGPIFESL